MRSPALAAIRRPYPEATVGTLVGYRSAADSLVMAWDEGDAVAGESVIRLQGAGENSMPHWTATRGCHPPRIAAASAFLPAAVRDR